MTCQFLWDGDLPKTVVWNLLLSRLVLNRSLDDFQNVQPAECKQSHEKDVDGECASFESKASRVETEWGSNSSESCSKEWNEDGDRHLRRGDKQQL